jgi:hypothetical protein
MRDQLPILAFEFPTDNVYVEENLPNGTENFWNNW